MYSSEDSGHPELSRISVCHHNAAKRNRCRKREKVTQRFIYNGIIRFLDTQNDDLMDVEVFSHMFFSFLACVTKLCRN